jgi:VWFA-related protein
MMGLPLRLSVLLAPALFYLPSVLPQSASPGSQAAAQEQRPGPPGTIRVQVRLIPVDVTVTDAHGRPVTDLKPEDFQILENGRLQEIRHFSVQTYSETAAAPSQPGEARLAPTADFAPRTARTFLILMGRGRYQTPFQCVDALIRFIREGLLPQDRVALFAYNRATDFTTDHEQIVQVLERYKQMHDEIESWLESRFSGLTAVYASKEIPKSFQKDIDKIFAGPEELASRQVPPGRMTEEGKLVKDWERTAGILLAGAGRSAETDMRKTVADSMAEEAKQSGDATLAVAAAQFNSLLTFDKLEMDSILLWMPFDQFAPKAAGSFQDMQNIYTCIEYLRYVSGEKHLLFLSDKGLLFPSGRTDFDKNIAAIANDARVAIDSFQTGGVFADPDRYPNKGQAVTLEEPIPPLAESDASWSQTFMISSMRTVSQLTGGTVSVYQDIGKTLDRINESSRVVYLLGYYPTNERWDGRYREINVKVNRPGVKVSFRHGYFARDRLEPFDMEAFISFNRITAAGGYEKEINDLPFDLKAVKAKDQWGQQQVNVGLQIDCAKIGFDMLAGRHSSKLRVTIFQGDPKGNYLGADWKMVTFRLLEGTFQQCTQSGIPVSIEVPLRHSKAILKVIVYDLKGDKVGSQLCKVK